MNETIAVIGGGAWGTALAVQLARRGRPVRLWVHDPGLARQLGETRENARYLPGVPFPESIETGVSLEAVTRGASVAFAVVPSRFARTVYRELAPGWSAGCLLVLAGKGIEEESLALPDRVATDELGAGPRVALSGPCFAEEVARRMPTAAVAASADAGEARRVQDLLSGDSLRVYTHDDIVGVQLGGALKNVIAIAAGVVDGIGFGQNTLSALVTRGLTEMTRLGEACGGRRATLSGLAGLGDLVATCTGRLSRNRALGQALGRGERLEDALDGLRGVAEGVGTTRAAYELARASGVTMPIVDEMYRILYEEGSPHDAVARLMSRPLTAESDDPREVAD